MSWQLQHLTQSKTVYYTINYMSNIQNNQKTGTENKDWHSLTEYNVTMKKRLHAAIEEEKVFLKLSYNCIVLTQNIY